MNNSITETENVNERMETEIFKKKRRGGKRTTFRRNMTLESHIDVFKKEEMVEKGLSIEKGKSINGEIRSDIYVQTVGKMFDNLFKLVEDNFC